MTQKYSVDVAIIGAGTAGLTARRAAKTEGASVLMIDAGPFGTTCARVGCMPSKLLIAASDVAHQAEHAAQFGIHPENVRVDGKAVLSRVRAERDRFVGFVDEVIDEAQRDGELLVGHAKIEAPGRLAVSLNSGAIAEVSFNSLVVASGSSPLVPPPFQGLEAALLTTDEIFELADLPKSLLVIGLGVIGLELGQAMSRLGVRTTLLGVGGGIGPLTDPQVLQDAKHTLSCELDLHPDYELKAISTFDNKVKIAFVDSRGIAREEEFDRVLMAAGRKANLSNLGLESLGAQADERGRFKIDPTTLQLEALPVFVAGDVNNLHPLLHEAADDGKFAARNAANFPEIWVHARRTPLGIVFTDPQMAVVGTGFAGLKNCQAMAGEVSYSDQGRARVHRINRGTIRIYAERKSGILLGAELFGPRAEHLSHLLAWAVQKKLTVEEALAMPFYHPTLEEGLRTALRDLNAKLHRDLPIKCRVSELGAGN